MVATNLVKNLVLHHDEYGGNLVGEHVGVCRGSQPLASHGDYVESLRQLVEEVRVTRLDLVAESGAAVRHQGLQWQPGVGDAEVHGLGDLGGVVEVQDIAVPVIGLVDEVEHDLHHGVQELAGELLRVRAADEREDVCKVSNSIEESSSLY